MEALPANFGVKTIYEPFLFSQESAHFVDVVAVPGLGADADAWLSKGVSWLSDENMLPSSIPRSRIMRFTYESSWFGKDSITQRLPVVADELLRGIIDLRKDCSMRPLVFIGHCFGGFIIQKAILLAQLQDKDYPLLAKCLAGVIFLGTPHKDSQAQSKASIIAAIASSLGYGEQRTLLNSVERDSNVLSDLLQDFTRVANIHSIPLFCFFERLKSETMSPEISRANDEHKIIVDQQSGSISGFPKVSLSAEHFFLNKFAESNDANYMLVRDQVTKFVEEARGCVANRMRDPHTQLELSKENEKYLNALFMTEPSDDMEIIEQNNGGLLEGSGSWLQEDANYRAWFDDKGTKVLWIHGDPGKGKTMLAISVVKTILERMKLDTSASEICFAYFFCDNKDNRRNSSVAILRSLIYQILHQRPDLCFHFRTAYEREGDQLFTSQNALQSLWRILRKILSSSGHQKVYIIIDALDESDERSTKDMLNLLKPFLNPESDIYDDQTSLNEKTPCEVKWLLTSRNIDFLSRSLCGTLNVSLESNANLVQDAVWKFIDQRVDKLQRLKGYDASLTELVRHSLREKSQGTFLYVSMAYRELSQPGFDVTKTESVLKRLPRGLLPLYERIMAQINAAEDGKLAAHAKAILRAMVLALRPLTIQELAIAANLPHKDTDILGEYVASCGSFITRRQDNVNFVHESVKTYLCSIDGVFSSPMDLYHAELTRYFLRHIGESKENKLDMGEVASPLGYPTSFWIYHARRSGQFLSWEVTLRTDFFLSISQSRQKWLDLYWVTNHQEWEKQPADFTPLHLAAYGGISSLASALLARGDAVDDADSNGHTALIWAAKNGHDDVVRIVLGSGADCEAKTNDGLTALLWATINGHHGVVLELIKYGASVRVTDSMGWTPLHHAASHGHRHVVIDLLAAGADIDAKDVCQQSALQRATFCVDLEIIKILVEKGADISVKDKDGLTLLHLAARDGHLDLVDFWHTHSGDLETKDDQGWTPLMHAAWFGHHNITSYLIQNGAKLETRSLDGNTSLHLATWNGHAHVVKGLLDAKADPNSECDRQETPLQQAAWRGHAVVCQLLLESGVDANAKSDSEATPLHQAAANGHEVVSRLLLEFGGDPNSVDRSKQTPGARAEENNHLALAKLLKSLEIKGDEEDLDTGQDEGPGEFEELDPAVCQLLKVPLESCIGQPHGKPGFSKPTKVTALVNGKARHYFMKSGPIGEMFASEHAALRALHDTVPSICPYSLGHGKFSKSSDHFLLMEFVDVTHRDDVSSGGSVLSLAQKLAILHTTTAPVPTGYDQPMFGFPVPTYCGSTWQNNSFCASWPKFFSDNRLLAVIQQIDEMHGTNQELRAGIEAVVRVIVPRLLGNGHLGGRRGITPVLVHGDLWIGNRVRGKIATWESPEEVVYDPSACYAHSEFELGIMRMFGGFSAGFFHEYHRLVPRTDPKEEYEDRLKLYQLYQYLNHYLIFRGGYKDDAMDVIKTLLRKYSDSELQGLSD